MSNQLWEGFTGKRLLLIALLLCLISHGAIIYYTLPKTYDAYIHMFFADHYSRFWFEPFEFRWYTGFLVTSYPPLNHQMVALISKVFPLKVAFSIYAIFLMQVLVVGVYRFAKLFFNKTTAGVAAILTIVLSSIVETLHVYGQLPTLSGLAFLLNALPFLYQFIRTGKKLYLVLSLVFTAVVICSHHVTVIFGLVFFIAPTIFMALVDNIKQEDIQQTITRFIQALWKSIWNNKWRIIVFGLLLLVMVIGLIFPYWHWSKTDPITQVAIPHGSRDNFLENFSSGLVFFIIPLLLIISVFPAIVFAITQKKRFFGWAVAFFVCLIFGLGGTTPLAKLILGEYAFNILTLDRFGFWASIIAIPFMAHFIYAFTSGKVRTYWISRFSEKFHFLIGGVVALGYFLFLIFIFHLGSFRPLQPKEVEVQPIVNFLNRDQHDKWRYLTLGFGDQMAWLSANTLASTVDGNYHSARRLPALTSRPIERLENAKFSGDDGLASLRHFLTNAEDYSLKYVFSNDRYYDPLLYYLGWSRTIRLENGIMVWEKGNISTIPSTKKKTINKYLRIAWGVIPISCLFLAVCLTLFYLKKSPKKLLFEITDNKIKDYPDSISLSSISLSIVFIVSFLCFQIHELLLVKEQKTAKSAVMNYFNHLDFQRFEKAFGFFKPSVTYTLDQYILEKSVLEGGLIPTYAKLDSISIHELKEEADTSFLEVHTIWNTSLGKRNKLDTLQLVKENSRWYILPPNYVPEIPEEQVRSYTYTLFRKQGKRVISSFPTVKDDRVKKSFAKFKQANIVKYEGKLRVVGELLNADDIPVNFALRAMVKFENDSIVNFYPGVTFLYNLGPKASSFFQIDLGNCPLSEDANISSIELVLDTDVSERGYIHGGEIAYKVQSLGENLFNIQTEIYDELTIDINVPAYLMAEKDSLGRIWQTKLLMHDAAVRSGLHTGFDHMVKLISKDAVLVENIPLSYKINGQIRQKDELEVDPIANQQKGILIQSHCFMSQEIYLQ